mgnify:CR=1 FL=1|tara:strand:+ start:608 stop:853 length:246 start_codon:yes stop_codon:yes gene_type:complete
MSSPETVKKGRRSLNLTPEEYRERANNACMRHRQKVGVERVNLSQKNYYNNNEEYRLKKIERMREYRERKRAEKQAKSADN